MLRRQLAARLAVPAALALLAACGDATAPAPTPTAARLGGTTSVFSVPDTVRAGQPFVVRVATDAGRCDLAAAPRLAVGPVAGTTGPVAVVRPEVIANDAACADAGRRLTWEATVTFAEPGFGTVEFRGADGSWSFGLHVVQ